MAADYRHIGGLENRLGRHYSRFSPFSPTRALESQSLALRKLCDAGSNRRSRASLERPTASGAWPGVHVKHLDIIDIEPLRAEIVSFLESASKGTPPAVSGLEGRNALSLALRTLERIREHAEHPELTANVL